MNEEEYNPEFRICRVLVYEQTILKKKKKKKKKEKKTLRITDTVCFSTHFSGKSIYGGLLNIQLHEVM